MPTLKEWTPGQVVQIMVYAPPGAGKTWGALTFPRPNVIDFDFGIATGRNPAFVAKYGLVDVQFEQFKEKKLDARGVPIEANAFDDACRYFDAWMKPDKVSQFDTWVIDSGTSLSQAAMNKAIILLGGGTVGIKSGTHGAAKQGGIVYPKQQDYGAERSMVEQFIRMVKDSGKNVVFVCHEKVETDADGNTIARMPRLTGGSVAAISAMFDEVWAIKVTGSGTQQKRSVITAPEMLYMAKSRTGIPSNQMTFDWPSVKAAIDTIRKG